MNGPQNKTVLAFMAHPDVLFTYYRGGIGDVKADMN